VLEAEAVFEADGVPDCDEVAEEEGVAVIVALAELLLVTDAVGVGDSSSHRFTPSTASAVSSRESKKLRTLNCSLCSPSVENVTVCVIHGVCPIGSSLAFMAKITRPVLATGPRLTSNTRASSGKNSFSIVSNSTLSSSVVTAPT
jgi:hypothetical protein